MSRLFKTNRFFNAFLRTILLSALLGLLIGLDFVLFLRSGSVFSLNNGVIMPISLVLAYLLAFSFVLMFITSFSPKLQTIVFALCCCVLAWGAMNQFLQVDKSLYISLKLTPFLGTALAGLLNGYSHWIILAAVFVAVCYLLHNTTKANLAYSAGIVLFIIIGFVGVGILLAEPLKHNELVYTSTEQDFNTSDQKVVFLLLPNAVANYSVLSDETKDTDKSQLLKKIELGFMMRHGFKVYPNSYMIRNSMNDNLVELFNILDNKPASKHTLDTVKLESLWKFKAPRKIETVLKDNQLQDIYKKAKYKVSAYQNTSIDICKKNNQFTVDRCVSRATYPFDITDTEFTLEERANLLLVQWLNSLEVFEYQPLVSMVENIAGKTIAKKMFLPYDRIYVAHSLQILQNLLDDIIADKQAGAYFVYLDFPDDFYVYNEWCQIKPRHSWNYNDYKLKLPNLSSSTADYNSQMLCFWGQMEDLMQNIEHQGLANKLTLIIQGIGNRINSNTNTDFISQFKNGRAVLTAIRTPQSQFEVDNHICQSKDILRQALFMNIPCKEFNGFTVASSTLETLRKNLDANIIDKAYYPKLSAAYEKWLSEWQSNHQPFLKINTTTPSKIDNNEENNAILEEEAIKVLMETGTETKPESEHFVTENKIEISLPENKVIIQSEPVKKEIPAVHEDSKKEEIVAPVTPKIEDVPLEHTPAPVPTVKPSPKPTPTPKTKTQVIQNNTDVIPIKVKKGTKKVKVTVTQPQTKPVIVKTADTPIHAEYHQSDVSGDFLLHEENGQWELDPAKALGVSGEDENAPKIIVKVK